MFQPGTRVYDTLTNHEGITVSQEYAPDNGGIGLVVDVVSDKTGKRYTPPVRRLAVVSSLR